MLPTISNLHISLYPPFPFSPPGALSLSVTYNNLQLLHPTLTIPPLSTSSLGALSQPYLPPTSTYRAHHSLSSHLLTLSSLSLYFQQSPISTSPCVYHALFSHLLTWSFLSQPYLPSTSIYIMLTIPFLPTSSLGALSLSLYLQPSLTSTSPRTHHAPSSHLLT